MAVIGLIIFIGLYIYELNYYKKYDVPYMYALIGMILIIVQLVEFAKGEFDTSQATLSSYIGYYIWYFRVSIVAVFITYLPIYKLENKFSTINIIENYIYILKTNNSKCTRSDFWVFTAFNLIVFFIISILMVLLQTPQIFMLDLIKFIIVVIISLNLVFQAKRLNDIGISKYFLLAYLFTFLGESFVLAVLISMIGIMCLPPKES